MAKSQPKKKSSPLKWLIIGGGAVVIYLLAFPADDSKTAAATKSTAKKKTTTEQKYTAEDFQRALHPFDPLKAPVINAFKPAVFRPTGGIGKTGWPIDLGGAGWTYSGMAVVDGKRQGLLENSSTGETALLQKNDSWSGAKVGEISADHMVFIRPDGPVTVHVEEAKDTPTNSSASTANNVLPAPMAPMPIPMAGAIGTAGQDMSISLDNTAGQGRGNGRRRRRNAG